MSGISKKSVGKIGRYEFLQRIESLRGLAALSVAVHHSFLFIQGKKLGEDIDRGIIQSIFYGHGAVLCFFVLSGLVLGQSLRRLNPKKFTDFLTFYGRRLFRIGPAFIISLVFCIFLLAFFDFWKSFNPAATKYYFLFYDFKPSLKVFISNVFLREFTLNNVTWSLYPEILGSLMLPVLHVASKSWFSRLAILLGLVLLQLISLPTSGQFFPSLPYLWIFYAGYLIADLPARFWFFCQNKSIITKLLLAMAWLICLATPHFGHHPIPYVLAMGFIIAIIFGLPNESAFTFLDHRATAFLGRVSYSFYLLHFPIAYSLVSGMLSLFNYRFLIEHYLLMSSILTVLSVSITAPVSWCSYNYVEKPFISFGKKLFSKSATKIT